MALFLKSFRVSGAWGTHLSIKWHRQQDLEVVLGLFKHQMAWQFRLLMLFRHHFPLFWGVESPI